MNHKPYIPPPWQLPHMLATPIGGAVLMVERCEHSSPQAKSAVHDMLKDRWAFRSQELEIDGRIDFELIECQDDRYNVSPWFACPLGPVGTVLACKERWANGGLAEDGRDTVAFESDGSIYEDAYLSLGCKFDFDVRDLEKSQPTVKWIKWRSARSMPPWACRLFFRTTAIDLRRVDTMTEEEALAWGCGIKPKEQIRRRRGEWIATPLNDAKDKWLADNPGATWGDWAWFIQAERVE